MPEMSNALGKRASVRGGQHRSALAASAGSSTPRASAWRWADLAEKYSRSSGVPKEFFLTLIQAESGGSPTALGDAGQSVGLFQLHSRGAGAGYTVEERYSPTLQFNIMTPRIQAAYLSGRTRGLSGRDLAMWVGQQAERPAASSVPRYGTAWDQITGAVGGGSKTASPAAVLVQRVTAGGASGASSAPGDGSGKEAPAGNAKSGDAGSSNSGGSLVADLASGVNAGMLGAAAAGGPEAAKNLLQLVLPPIDWQKVLLIGLGLALVVLGLAQLTNTSAGKVAAAGFAAQGAVLDRTGATRLLPGGANLRRGLKRAEQRQKGQ
jgi:hypothetical protein